MAESRSGAREVLRGVVAAVIVLALMMFGVRTMVGRMSERARATTPGPGPGPGADPGAGADPSPAGASAPGPAAASAPGPAAAPARVLAPGPAPATALGSATPPPPTALVHRGTLDAVAVREVVRSALPEIRFCFEWELDAHPDLAGRVTMQFTIQEDGSVADASVLEDALHDETVTNCFTHVMSHLRFAPPEGGSVLVNYPFSLSGSPEARRPEGI